jgi:predicted metalloendopeptidase
MGAAGRLQARGMPALFTVSSVINPMDPTNNMLEFDQGGFALPAREMYLSPSQLLTDYQTHVTKVLLRLQCC